MQRAAGILIVAFLWCFTAAGVDVRGQLEALIDGPAFAQAQWGIKICSLDTGGVIFSHNAGKLFKPASNAKLYTAALALDRLGKDFRIKTSCYAAVAPDADGVIHGDLVIYGRGDPCFSARFNDGDYSKALSPLIDAIAKAGVKRVEGGLVGNDSYFSGPPYGADWAWDDLQNYYGAPASALTFQDNVIDIVFKPGKTVGEPCQILTTPETGFVAFSNRTHTVTRNEEDWEHLRVYVPLGENVAYVTGNLAAGSSSHADSISVHDPALWFVTMLKDGLARRGITVLGNTRSVGWLDAPQDISQMVEVAAVSSRPLSEIVKFTLKPSENLYAQLLLLQVGAHARLKAPHDTVAEGLRELGRFLEMAGIDTNGVLLEEGSGLSRGCLVTPAATAQLLTFMSHHRDKDSFIDALPIAGVDGTLRTRFKNTFAAGNVRAKTGSLEYVNTLSGYLTNKAGQRLVFSVMLNNYHEEPGAPSGRAAIDALVGLLVDSP